MSELRREKHLPLVVSHEGSLPTCGLHLERGEEGYQVGSYMFNIVASEILFAIVFLAVLLFSWPSPPWRLLEYGGDWPDGDGAARILSRHQDRVSRV